MNKTRIKKPAARIAGVAASAAMAVMMLSPTVLMTPVFAATNTQAVIDQGRTGTLRIHKIVENDGTLTNADGLAIANPFVTVDNVGFDYVQIAKIRMASGIVISKDGRIAYDEVSGLSSVGTYYEPNEKMEELFKEAGETPEAVYLLEQTGSGLIRQQLDRFIRNRLLSSEQQAVDEAAGTLNSARNALQEARRSRAGAAEVSAAYKAYTEAQKAYEEKIAALDEAASQNGIQKLYTAEGLEKAMQKVITTLGEDRINQWVSANAPTKQENTLSTFGEQAEGYTDETGTVTFDNLDLGLYIVAETDLSGHDGKAGAWNDLAEGGSINNNPANTYDRAGGTYTVTDIDGWAEGSTHEYHAGDYYHESHSPEGTILETPAAPFLVSLPTTNTTDSEGLAAEDDNAGTTGTVWQYTVDVYPKNQTTSIYKRIVDPDEQDGKETLRTSEDYQVGDLIEQVIWADAPILQKNYLWDASDEGFGEGAEGDLTDRDDYSASKNEHIGYVISDTMTKGLTFDKVTKVAIIPKQQLASAGEEGEPASALTPIPQNVDAFDVAEEADGYEGEVLTAGEDYTVVNTNDEQVDLVDSEGKVQTVVERITSDDTHGFAVVLTDAGLAKLNSHTTDSVVVVYFDSILNKAATIGQISQNMNYPSLSWVNTNTSFRTIRGNEVYDYTYELQLQKNGVRDASNVKFIVSRTDMDIANGDVGQVSEKDLTDTVSQQADIGSDDSIRFVKEKDGIYHVWGFLAGENEDEGDPADSFEISRINGKDFNTVTPAKDGSLVLKGLDSNDYTFTEIRTEDGNNLLKETFTVSIRANDDETASVRDGSIATATVRSAEGAETDLTIGVAGVTEGQDSSEAVSANPGIASMEVKNFDAIDLRTGGTGTVLLYAIAGALAAGLGVGIFVNRKKNKKTTPEA